MGKDKYRKDIDSLFAKSFVVSYDSINRIVKDKKNTQYIKKLVHYLLLKNKIKRLAKGYYTTRDDASLAVFAFQPAYLGLQDALSFYDLWEQETIPIIITTRKVRQGIRKSLGQNILIRRIKKKYLFGIEYYPQGDIALPYSDIEKTFIDMIYFREDINKEALFAFKKKLNKKKLISYLRAYPKKFHDRVKVYIK